MLCRRILTEGAVSWRVVAAASFSTTSNLHEPKSYKMVVVGGGSGGMAAVNKFSKKLGQGNVALIEPADVSKNGYA